MKLRGMGLEGFSIEHEKVDLRCVEQLVDPEQTEALAICLRYLEQNLFDGKRPLAEAVAKLEKMIESQGLAALTAGSQGVPLIARPRREEMFAAVNRYRRLKLKGNH